MYIIDLYIKDLIIINTSIYCFTMTSFIDDFLSIYNNSTFIKNNYPNLNWILDDTLDKKLNYVHLFSVVADLIKPPFVIKSVVIPKKLRKKTKQKYLTRLISFTYSPSFFCKTYL